MTPALGLRRYFPPTVSVRDCTKQLYGSYQSARCLSQLARNGFLSLFGKLWQVTVRRAAGLVPAVRTAGTSPAARQSVARYLRSRVRLVSLPIRDLTLVPPNAACSRPYNLGG